jgi:neutral ceramidase
MSGRRIRHAVQQVLGPIGIEQVVLAGYANSYAGYVTTREEYELQYYEGASTHFGPWTQAAYQQGFGELAESMARQTKLAPGPVPRDLRPTLAQTEKIMEDRAPLGASFGDVRADAQARYAKGETVKVEFIGSNLNANLKPAQSIAWVEQWQVDQWQPVRFDWDVDTYLTWENIGLLRSIVSFEWQIPANAQSGKYRIVYESDAHPLIGQARRFKGVSREFEVR